MSAYITPNFGTYIPAMKHDVYGYYNRYWVDLTQSIRITNNAY